MKVMIREQIVPVGESRPGTICEKNFITIHETGDFRPGASAKVHAQRMSSGSGGKTGYHYTVDDTEIYHHIPDEEKACHAADGARGMGNLHSIGIAICVNRDGDFEKAKKNAAWLTALLMEKYEIPIHHVVQHYYWSGKNCPGTIRKTGTWSEFLEDCRTFYARRKHSDEADALKKSVRPEKTVEELAQEVLRGEWGTGTARQEGLIAAGYNCSAVLRRVRELI